MGGACRSLDSIDPPRLGAQLQAPSGRGWPRRCSRDGTTWGDVPARGQRARARRQQDDLLRLPHVVDARAASAATCSMKANEQASRCCTTRAATSRNWTTYNFQTLRDDVFMLGRTARSPATASRRRARPARCSSARRTSTASGSTRSSRRSRPRGFSGQAFSTFVPHTVRATETKHCTDCHVSRPSDNNAWMAHAADAGHQLRELHRPLRLRGRGRPAASRRSSSPSATSRRRSSAATCTSSPIPTDYEKHQRRGRSCARASITAARRTRSAADEVLAIQLRGEYLYAANGAGGLPRLRRGADRQQGLLRAHRHRAGLAARPAPLREDEGRDRGGARPRRWRSTRRATQRPENEEQKIHPVYAYLYVTDREEGLVVIGNPLDSPTGRACRRCSTAIPTTTS